jgi:hypothetical protein
VKDVKIARALFSTDAEALDLYDKPLARNCQLWDDDFNLLLNGPGQTGRKSMKRKNGSSGRTFRLPLFLSADEDGWYRIYWHRR